MRQFWTCTGNNLHTNKSAEELIEAETNMLVPDTRVESSLWRRMNHHVLPTSDRGPTPRDVPLIERWGSRGRPLLRFLGVIWRRLIGLPLHPWHHLSKSTSEIQVPKEWLLSIILNQSGNQCFPLNFGGLADYLQIHDGCGSVQMIHNFSEKATK